MRALVLPVLSLCLLTGTLLAHGGRYRGPTTAPGGRLVGPTSPGARPTGPTTGGPGAPGVPGIPAGAIPDATRWQVWWELNKDPYLRDPAIARQPRTPRPARKVISERQKLDVILPALKKALDETSNQHITSAGMIALAKIGLDHPQFKILDEFKKRLKRGNQEIREVAALSMGISKQPAAIPILRDIYQDTPAGRRLVGRDSVSARTRAFAGYGLGLIAHGTEDVKVKSQVLEILKAGLAEKDTKNRDLLIATLNGFRLLNLRPESEPSHRRLLWSSLEALQAYQGRKMSKTRQMVQAHVPPAVARLLGRGAGGDQERFKKLYGELFKSRAKRHATLYQSATIAMGRLMLATEVEPKEKEHDKRLQRHLKGTRDHLTSYFGLIAMGQIGGKTNIDRLIHTLKRGKRMQQGWAALALGLAAFHAPQKKPDPRTQSAKDPVRDRIGAELYKALLAATNRDVRAAAALGLGLANYKKSAKTLRKLLKKYQKIEEFAGYIALGLAMMEDKASGELIDGIMSRSSRKPLLMVQTALALARLKHPGASITLRSVLRSGGALKTITLASAANAMGFLADPGNVQPLVAILRKTSNDKMSRAFAAVALGSMAENDSLTWSAWIAMNMNYSATVETLSNGSAGVLDIL